MKPELFNAVAFWISIGAGNLLALVYIAVKSRRGLLDLAWGPILARVLGSGLLFNLVSSIAFGVSISAHVVFGSSDSSFAVMPLVMAPLGYWALLFLPVFTLYGGLAAALIGIKRFKSKSPRIE
jgi:hypothetical protein